MQTTNFVDCPTEILLKIFTEADAVSLLKLRETCHRFLEIIEDSHELRYHIELFADGLVKVPELSTDVVPLDTRMNQLIEHRVRWKSIEPIKVHQVPRFHGGTYDIAGGVYGQIHHEFVAAWQFAESLVIHTLPSQRHGSDSMSSWTLDNLPHRVGDFVMDPGQDLLVIMNIPRFTDDEHPTISLHILSLKCGQKHPHAAAEFLNIEFSGLRPGFDEEDDVEHVNDSIHICDNLICTFHLFIDNPDTEYDRVTVWDWKSGTRIMSLIDCGISSCVFLTNELMLFGMQDFRRDGIRKSDMVARLIVCDIMQTSVVQKQKPNAFANRCEFHFPPKHEDATVISIKVRTHPHTTPSLKPGTAFTYSPDNRLVVATLIAKDVLDEIHTFRFLIPLSTILSQVEYLNVFPTDIVKVSACEPGVTGYLTEIPRNIAVKWEHWGLKGSRVFYFHFDVDGREHSYPPVYGSRYLPPPLTSTSEFNILDFNTRIMKLEAGRAGVYPTMREPMRHPMEFLKKVEATDVTTSSVIRAEKVPIFIEDIETQLPYRQYTVQLHEPIYYALITEDNILLDFVDCVDSTIVLGF